MQYIPVPVPEDRLQEVFSLLAGHALTEPAGAEVEPMNDLPLVVRVTQEAPPPIRALLSHLAQRPDEAIAFSDLSRELGIPPFNLRAEMAQFSARWADKYRQDKRKWFFDVITAESGRVKYRMNARIAEAVGQALGDLERE